MWDCAEGLESCCCGCGRHWCVAESTWIPGNSQNCLWGSSSLGDIVPVLVVRWYRCLLARVHIIHEGGSRSVSKVEGSMMGFVFLQCKQAQETS